MICRKLNKSYLNNLTLKKSSDKKNLKYVFTQNKMNNKKKKEYHLKTIKKIEGGIRKTLLRSIGKEIGAK